MKFFYIPVCLWTIVYCDEHTHTYKDGEQVVLWMNTVGPYHNLQETYAYFSLPFCVGTEYTIWHYRETLSEALQGVKMECSGLDITYKDNVPAQQFCAMELNEKSFKALVYAVKNHYWYQMYIDDLPIWGTVGEIDGEHYYIWTHKKFNIGYNDNRIVEVNLATENRERLTPDAKIPFTYEVNWLKSDIQFKERFDVYLDSDYFELRIRWISIFISFMMIVFLVGLISKILMTTLRKDYARYSKDDLDDLDKDSGDEYHAIGGWKQVFGDVFRPVPHLSLFSALIGSGYQLTVVTLAVIIFAIFGEFYKDRGSLLSTAVFIYAATSPINGYFGGSLYARMGGKLWIKQMLLSAFFVPVLVCGTAFFINFIAIFYHAPRAIPVGSMMADMSICTFVILPLTLVGTVLGRKVAGQPDYPCRINAVPRPIPERKWFTKPFIIILVGGILPFGSIFIETYFIFTSYWAFKVHYMYGFMLLVFLILMAVTVRVTIVSTYFLLNAEDYRWQWTSFLSACSTAIYVYLYSFYYFVFRTKIYGFQTTIYLDYIALFSLTLGIICGTVGYLGTSLFVKKNLLYTLYSEN